MKIQSKITDIIFDFDGTCTQIPQLYKGFQESYFIGFAKQMEKMQLPITKREWEEALEQVRLNSPYAGWTVATCPSAPAAADPYILTFEAACFILRQKNNSTLPDIKIFTDAYGNNPPLWREDAAKVFIALQQKGVRLHFISNSSTAVIHDRLKLLPEIGNISVEGGAAKFRISELVWDPDKNVHDMPVAAKKQFNDLPAANADLSLDILGRPCYQRRGSYFSAIYRSLGNDLTKLATTVFCGDIWELDLAMPQALGANIHLIERAAPFNTYEYEFEVVRNYGKRAKTGKELSSLLEWLNY